MDVYHKALMKLYEVTEGKDTQAVDFKELVKELGFLGSYPDIFSKLSGQGWIAETRRTNTVKITHWGVKEIKRSLSGVPNISESAKTITKETNRLVSETKDLLIMLDEFKSDSSEENFSLVEKKIKELNTSINKIRDNI